MSLLTLSLELKLQIFEYAFNDIEARIESAYFARTAGGLSSTNMWCEWLLDEPYRLWRFEWYDQNEQTRVLSVGLLATCRQLGQDAGFYLLSSKPLRIRSYRGDNNSCFYPSYSLVGSAPSCLGFFITAQQVDIDSDLLDDDKIEVLPTIFPRLKNVIIHHVTSKQDQGVIHRVSAKAHWSCCMHLQDLVWASDGPLTNVEACQSMFNSNMLA